jgi:DNA-directed RNA polymerase subunit L
MTEDDIENYDDGSIELELNVLNEGNNMLNVTRCDIKAYKNGKELSRKELDQMFPANSVSKSHILITRLRTNEHLHFKTKVIKKTARSNAAFNPVSLSNFFYMQDPVAAKKKESVLDKERSYFTNKYGDANVIQFEIESINHLIGPKYLVNKAIDIIIDKLNTLITNIMSEAGTDMIHKLLDNTYEFVIQNEDDTLGNIIQSYVHSRYVREEKPAIDGIHCSYIGYICPHPLKTELIIRITLDDQVNPVTFTRFLEANCRMIMDEMTVMKNEWNQFI